MGEVIDYVKLSIRTVSFVLEGPAYKSWAVKRQNIAGMGARCECSLPATEFRVTEMDRVLTRD